MAWIDRDMVLEIVGGDVIEARRLLALFFDSARDQMHRLRESLREKNWERLDAAAHQLAGASGTCGLASIGERLRALEQRPPEELPAGIEARIEEIDSMLQQAAAEMGRAFASSPGDLDP